MFSLLKTRLLSYLTPILVTLFLSLLAALGTTGYLYKQSVAKNEALSIQLQGKDAELARTNRQLKAERATVVRLKAYSETIKTKMEELKNEATTIPTNPDVPALDPAAVGKFLCARSLASASACRDASAQ